VASLEWDIAAVFYYLGASEIWSDQRGVVMIGGALLEGDSNCCYRTVYHIVMFYFLV